MNKEAVDLVRLLRRAEKQYYFPIDLCSAVADVIETQAGEILRLRSGGCSRDQKSTQWCAEAVKLQKHLAYLQASMDRILDYVENDKFAFKRAVIAAEIKACRAALGIL